MPIEKETVEAYVAKLNAARRADQHVQLVSYEAPRRFTLSFPNRPMPDGACIDQDFTEIQFALFEEKDVTTGIVEGKLDEESDRYVMTYEVTEWD